MMSHTKLAVAIAMVCFVAYVHSDRLLGGLEDEKPVDAEVLGVLASVEADLKKEFPAGYTKIEPLGYRTQVVAGKNYYIRAAITNLKGKTSQVHLRVYHPFKGANELTAVKANVNETTPLLYFQ